MTDFYSETVRRLTDLERRLRVQEGKARELNMWLKRARTVTIAANTMDGAGLGYAKLDPTPATTNLNTISNGANGQILVIRTFDPLDTVTVKDSVGNISLPFSGDIVLDDPEKALMLLFDDELNAGSGYWIEIA